MPSASVAYQILGVVVVGDLVNDDDQADQQPQLPPNDILPIRPCQTLQSSQLNSFLQIPLILSHITYPPK